MIYVGLDVSLNSVAICAVDETGMVIREETTRRTRDRLCRARRQDRPQNG